MIERIVGFILVSLLVIDSFANPAMHITAGQATIKQTRTSVEVNQTSPLLILNAQDFNIQAHEKVSFNQPDKGVVLIRIHSGKEAAKIAGELSAVGKVIIINQAGILFAKGAQVHIGGMVATTSDILDKNFLARKFTFDQPSPYAATVVNHGTIEAANHGIVALLGTAVENS